MTDNVIVFSGMAGRFAESDSVQEFWEKLVNGEDMITTDLKDRWRSTHYDFPLKNGTLKDLHYFDAEFFGIPSKQANVSGPALRILLEVVYEAIVDAGLNPDELRGTKTGVYMAVYMEDMDVALKGDTPTSCFWLDSGAFRFPNMTSFHFGLHGPSLPIDTACSSSFSALSAAFADLQGGRCDRAIVAGVSLCVDKRTTTLFSALGALSKDGTSCPFDERSNGYVRSEAVAVVLIEPSTLARRNYGEFVNVMTRHDGFKEDGVFQTSRESQEKLLTAIYQESKINLNDLVFVECHGTSTQVGDVNELRAIDSVLTSNRDIPLLIGSHKSNHGHSEAASGIVSLIKCLLALEHKLIPANLNFLTPNPKVDGLVSGRIKPVLKNTAISDNAILGLSGFGIGGVGGHAIIKSPRYVEKTEDDPERTIARLVEICGRNVEGVDKIVKFVEENVLELTEDFFGLLDCHCSKATPGRGMDTRGALLIDSDSSITNIGMSEVKQQRSIWFIMSGMGSHWPSMASGLLKIKTIARTIKKCSIVLEDFDLNLEQIIVEQDGSWMREHVPPFVAIVAVQIALIDLIHDLDIYPDGIVGFSIGDIAAAYADGCLNLKQAMLVAYWRGRCVEEANLKPGLMALVGLNWQECEIRCPKGVIPACQVAPKSVTVSGPRDAVRQFIDELHQENVFAQVVETNVIAYHHPDLELVRPSMMTELNTVISSPKARSEKWKSLIEQNSDQTWFAFGGPDYFVNNLVSPVMFANAIISIPDNSVIIEIGSHGLLQSAIQSMKPQAFYVDLMTKNLEPGQNLNYLLTSIGKLYIGGLNPSIRKLYEPMTFPVAKGTPSLGTLIKWKHTEKFVVHDSSNAFDVNSASDFITTVDINSLTHAFLAGHQLDGAIIVPGFAFVHLVWETLARSVSQFPERVAIELENVKFQEALVLNKASPSRVAVRLNKSSGHFTVLKEGGDILVQGSGRVLENLAEEYVTQKFNDIKDNLVPARYEIPKISKEEVYREFRVRGLQFSGLFQGIDSMDFDGQRSTVTWMSNFVTFMDSCCQIIGFEPTAKTNRKLFVLKEIRRLVVDPRLFRHEHGELIEVVRDHRTNKIACNLFVVEDLNIDFIDWFPNVGGLVNETSALIPNCSTRPQERESIMNLIVDAIHENMFQDILSIYGGETVHEWIIDTFKYFKKRSVEIRKVESVEKADIVIYNPQQNLEQLSDRSFVIVIGDNAIDINEMSLIISQLEFDSTIFRLFRRVKEHRQNSIIEVKSNNFEWIPLAIRELRDKPKNTIWFISCGYEDSGIIGFINCLHLEPVGERIRCVFAPFISHISDINLDGILNDDLVINVMDNELGRCRYGQQPINWTLGETKLSNQNCYLEIASPGDLSSLRWSSSPLGSRNNSLKVKHIGLNFRDVMQSLGQISESQNDLGFEFAGVTADGRRLMGTSFHSVLELSLKPSKFDLIWNIPDEWTLEEAATVPIVYLTCLYGMVEQGRLRNSASILIHCGAGGIGQAAIHIAQSFNCTIFTTCGNLGKREFLKQEFGLTDDFIFNSRDTSFEDGVKRATSGQGVDMILNCLAGDQLLAGLRCLKRGGKFIDLATTDISKNSSIGYGHFKDNRVLVGVQMKRLILDIIYEPWTKLMLTKLLQTYIENGVVKPITRTSFKMSEVDDAIRQMASGKNYGKFLINTHDAANEHCSKEGTAQFVNTKSYIIVGGLGGMGLELLFWMYQKGARRFVVTSRNGVQTTFQQYSIERLQSLRCEIIVTQLDVGIFEQCEYVFDRAEILGTVGGIFNLALNLKDTVFELQTPENFEVAGSAKIRGTQNLDILSRERCLCLDYFVCFSSIACGHGNPGQTSYGYACSVMEKICERRRRDLLHGLSIQWGFVGDVGFASNCDDLNEVLQCDPQPIKSCLNTLGRILNVPDAVVTSYIPKHRFVNGPSKILTDDPMQQIAHFLGVNNEIDEDKQLYQLGANSLTIAEVKQIIVKNMKHPQDLACHVKNLTFRQIRDLIY